MAADDEKQFLVGIDIGSTTFKAVLLDEYEREAGRGAVDRALLESLVDDLVSEGFFRQEGVMLLS